MALGIKKDCFPPPVTCHNCLRKNSSYVKKETDSKEDLKRCANCHLFTYCDKNCQKEHWEKVHKSHCKLLSGKVLVKNSKHDAATCPRCIDKDQASNAQLMSENSPKTLCNIEMVTILMKKALSAIFEFHKDGKNCECSSEFACELPFSLGEVSGQYVEIGSTGLDAMLAHTLKILAAMLVKAKVVEHKNALSQLSTDIIAERTCLWYDVLLCGMPKSRIKKHLSDQIDSLETAYGASNPWLKALKFSVVYVLITNRNRLSNAYDSRSLENPRFQNLKILHNYWQSQMQNQAIACQKKTWPNLMLWPGLVNGSLSVQLPPGARCQSCDVKLCGEVALSPHCPDFQTGMKSVRQIAYSHVVFSEVGKNGDIVACCPVAKNPNCFPECLSRNVDEQTSSDEELRKEIDLFNIESRDCDFCFKMSLFSHRCSSCRTVQYCSTVCQGKDMEFHKSVCTTWAKDKSRKILNKGQQKNYWNSFFELTNPK